MSSTCHWRQCQGEGVETCVSARRDAYLLEFFDIDIELTSKLRLGMGERRNLRAECTGSVGSCLVTFSFVLALSIEVLCLGIFLSDNSLEVLFAKSRVLVICLPLGLEPVGR